MKTIKEQVMFLIGIRKKLEILNPTNKTAVDKAFNDLLIDFSANMDIASDAIDIVNEMYSTKTVTPVNRTTVTDPCSRGGIITSNGRC